MVGGRFEVIDQIDEDAQAVVWSAKDQQTKRAILVRVIRGELVSSSAAPEFREACRTAATLSHRNIARVFGVGRTPRGEHFIAGEWIDGTRLSEFTKERARDGEPMSLRGIYNVVAHLCSALAYAHEKGPHGTLRPSVVWITRGGRVKIRDFGVGQVLLGSGGTEAFHASDHACLAPEVKRGEPATPRSDVFGIGAILYELLTARSPGTNFVAPSHARDDIPAEIDGILFQCLAPDPKDRFDTPEAVRNALLPFITQANSLPPPANGNASVDIDLGSVLPPADLEIPGIAIPEIPIAPPPAPKRGLMSMINQLSADTKQRWMVAQDKMDHGPFNARELIERLNIGGFSGNDQTLNTDTGERKPLREWPQFREFILQREHQDTTEAEQAARVNAHRSEKRSSAVKWFIAASLIGLVVISVGGFVLSRSSGVRELASTQLDDLFKLGKITTGEPRTAAQCWLRELQRSDEPADGTRRRVPRRRRRPTHRGPGRRHHEPQPKPLLQQVRRPRSEDWRQARHRQGRPRYRRQRLDHGRHSPRRQQQLPRLHGPTRPLPNLRSPPNGRALFLHRKLSVALHRAPALTP
ncbi:MAG: serine/threonine protein kinase [Deltaproteobacteria bacterium]|nr:serine/threonine protein kinase [Deltaproteobacteria bacterium]